MLSDNDEADSPAQAEGGFATGVGISGGQTNTFARNRISGNARAGVIFTNTEDLPATGNTFSANVYELNGVDVANLSAARSPATANCAEDSLSTAPADLALALTVACSGADATQPSIDAIDGPAVPPGLSYRKVGAPRDQPNLAASDSGVSLPATITMPDLDAVTVPSTDLLADLTGTR